MSNKFIIKIALLIQKIFYTFLDISGIILGIFLTWLGYWIISGHIISGWLGVLILIIGIGAMILHTGHYFSSKLTRWLFGSSGYFLRK